MLKNLHCHLRGGLDYEGLIPSSEDLLEPPHEAVWDPEKQAEKRRRVETIATGYLRGTVPVLLSTRLKGPFNKNWHNPWSGQNGRRLKVKTASNEKKSGTTSDPKSTIPDGIGKIRSKGVRKKKKDKRWDRPGWTDPKLATKRDDESGLASFFSGNMDQRTSQKSSGDNSQWLKRRPQYYDGKMTEAVCDIPAAASPTPSRHAVSHGNSQNLGEFSFAPPKSLAFKSSIPSLPKADALHRLGRLSAPAPTTIPSPAPSMAESTNGSPPTLPRHSPNANTEHSIMRASQGLHEAPATADIPSQSVQQIAGIEGRAKMQPSQVKQGSNERCRETAQSMSTSKAKPRSPSREEILRSAEQCTSEAQGGKRKKKRKRRTSRMHGEDSEQATTSHAASSTSFKYRRIGDSRIKAKDAGGPSQVVDKDSNATLDDKQAEDSSRQMGQLNAIADRGHRPRSDVYDVLNDGIMPDESFRSSRTSQLCTQAAFLQAQQEFQEGNTTTLAPETVRIPADQQHGTRQTQARKPSPAVTPFQAFNTELRGRPGSNPYGLISTQDLFDKASPFAFSTVKKKKGTVPKRSSLSFARLAADGVGANGDAANSKRSPTGCAERARSQGSPPMRAAEGRQLGLYQNDGGQFGSFSQPEGALSTWSEGPCGTSLSNPG